MEWIDILGYVASGLVFTTFCMKTMMPLRYLAILSNIGFIGFGILGQVYPVLILHVVLLPLNLWRLVEIKRLIGEVRRSASGDFDIDWLLPFMKRGSFAAGQVLFHKGDVAKEMYYLTEGKVRVVEPDILIGAGKMVGEMGMFAPSQRRSATVEAVTDIQVMSLSDQQVINLFHQNPSFGYFMTRLITARLIEGSDPRTAQIDH